MEPSTAIRHIDWPRGYSPIAGRLLRGVAVSWLALLAAAAILIGARRLGGALVEPLSPPTLVAWACFLAAAAHLFRAACCRLTPSRTRAGRLALAAVPSGVLVLSAAGLSLEGSTPGGLVALWGILALEEGWSWRQIWRQSVAPDLSPLAMQSLVESLDATPWAGDEVMESDAEGAISQRIVRRRLADGAEIIEGWVRADFAIAERHASSHVAICPPLGCLPECYAEQSDGPPAEIKVAQVLPYGVRFEIKLDAPAEEPSAVIVEFSIQAGVRAAD
jgi:hypothetical protein